MSLVLDNTEPAVNRGIKTVGVGKKGSKALSPEVAGEILDDLKAGKVLPAAKGAFFAGLLAKRLEPQEEILKEVLSIEAITIDAPEFVRWVCGQFLNGQTLDKQTAYDLGKF